MFKPKITLLQLFISLTFLTALLTIGSGLYGSYDVTKRAFVEEALDSNEVYAAKLADTADLYVRQTRERLQYSATQIANGWGDEAITYAEVERLEQQLQTFNSLIVINDRYEVIASSSANRQLSGQLLETETAREALRAKKSYVSPTYLTVTNKLAIFLSEPIVNEDGDILGIIGGTIYLKERNTLAQILGEHEERDGSSVYVVDQQGTILYHPNYEMIGTNASDRDVVKRIIDLRNGSMREVNEEGDVIAGYAIAQETKWGVISQRPYDKVIMPTHNIMLRTLGASFPFILLSLTLVFLTATYITKPLRNIALLAEQSSTNDTNAQMDKVNAWYYEAYQMKQSIGKSIGTFQDRVSYYHTQSVEDPLTGLTNRRTMDELLRQWTEEDAPFVILLIDLDHFKSVNDTYGHAVGDDVLRYLTEQMQQYVDGSSDEVCCRYGGEEFVILYKERPLPYVIERAEALRATLEQTDSPTGKPITMSAGVGAYPLHTNEADELFELVDEALYESKRRGRNQITVVQQTTTSSQNETND